MTLSSVYRFVSLLACSWLACFTLISDAAAQEIDYLSAAEAVAIGAGSVGILKAGLVIRDFDNSRKPLWKYPLGFEKKVTRFIGGEPKLGKRNFLDDNFGAAISVLAASVTLAAVDAVYPSDDETRDVLQDQFLYHSGLLATRGVTDIFKGLVTRPRPLLHMAPELAAQRSEPDYANDHHSFFSGHSSSAFFSMAYLNMRLRATMRREMTTQEYKRWRWLSPTVTFGWATFVGLSRVHAYRHYITDVAVGALAGYLIASLYYSFGDDIKQQTGAGDGSPMMIRVSMSF